jgi:hypothetical protein
MAADVQECVQHNVEYIQSRPYALEMLSMCQMHSAQVIARKFHSNQTHLVQMISLENAFYVVARKFLSNQTCPKCVWENVKHTQCRSYPLQMLSMS